MDGLYSNDDDDELIEIGDEQNTQSELDVQLKKVIQTKQKK